MPSKRAFAHGSVRAVAGLVGIGVAAAAVIAATWLPLPSVTAAIPSQTVTPVPADQQRTCPGPLLELAADSTDATASSAFGSPASVFDASPGEAQTSSLKTPDDHLGGHFGAPKVVSVSAKPGESAAPLIAGAQSQTAVQEDLAGFAAAGCGDASRSSWLVAGASDLGQTSLVLLSNPTAVQASVNLSVYAESGEIQAPGAQGILVDAGSQRVIALAGIAPNVKAPVVHVESTGGSVVATLQQSVVRGLTPGGVELAAPTSAPAKHQVISGLVIAGLAAQAGAVDGYADTMPALRVLVPGGKPATVRVGITPEKGTAGGTSTQATLQPKTAQELPLDNLVNGSFTVTVDADQPVVVAARVSTSGPAGNDFAWYAASDALVGDTMIAVAPGPGATVHLTNPTTTDATVSLHSTAGASEQTVTVAANSAVAVAVRTGLTYTLGGVKGLYASVSYGGSGLSSSFPVEPPGALASPIAVYPK
ncbi:DUF5719 family protein [Rathayibacter soli]|uniref:DUF5719 family protein n=1 Tax=Rathayibacter soli TaxID=3144168 RepID=UPI0027E5B218|nr:DUF5719 family protein [Glaciibacter superstes]